MAKGTPKSKYDPTLEKQVDKLIKDNKAVADATLQYGTGREWIHGSNDYELTDISGLKEPFKREDLQANYAIVMSDLDPGTAADKAAIKFQSDYLAAMERAYRLRHTGIIRTEIFAAMRRRLQSDTNLQEFTKANFERMRMRGQ
jgi:hypothetical protein